MFIVLSGMLLLLIHLTGSFSMCGRHMECYQRGDEDSLHNFVEEGAEA
ncbi:hypothetical protein GLYMA_10G118250v4 [Glycine max]|nr:hypothetical protein GLYMA_10G118250v4 [Glycine max]KAH1137819.1 hypothetical protein GYH30_027712 [Glycine max]